MNKHTPPTPEEIAERFPNVLDDGYRYSNIGIFRSAAGYYLGRHGWDPLGFEEPYSRESGYFETREQAAIALLGGFEIRDCIENDWAYASGLLPTLQKKKPVNA